MCDTYGFFGFFNDVILGKRESKPDPSDITTILRSQSTMSALSASVQNKLLEFTSIIDQNVVDNKDINISCDNSRDLQDYHLEPLPKLKTWTGKEINQTECVRWGCCYDVNQETKITLHAISEITTDQGREMWNHIKQDLEHKVNMEVTGFSSGETSLSETLNHNAVSSFCIENIRNNVRNMINNDIDSNQVINIKNRAPLPCINRCNEPPTAGIINQNSNIQILSQNIVHDIMRKITETHILQTSRTDSKTTNVSFTKLYLYSILTCLIIVAVYILCIVIGIAIYYVFIKKMPSSLISHIFAIILFILTYLFYSTILCIICSIKSGEGFFGALIDCIGLGKLLSIR